MCISYSVLAGKWGHKRRKCRLHDEKALLMSAGQPRALPQKQAGGGEHRTLGQPLQGCEVEFYQVYAQAAVSRELRCAPVSELWQTHQYSPAPSGSPLHTRGVCMLLIDFLGGVGDARTQPGCRQSEYTCITSG